jgi:hypothetical protein
MAEAADLELQGAIIAKVKADPGVTGLVATRIYETVPEGTAFPYVSYAGSDEVEDDAECIPGSDISVQIDVWSRSVGFPEAKRICLHDSDLPLADNALVFIEHTATRVFRDADGLTNHGVMVFQAFIERAP